jgi:hypothetical protein
MCRRVLKMIALSAMCLSPMGIMQSAWAQTQAQPVVAVSTLYSPHTLMFDGVVGQTIEGQIEASVADKRQLRFSLSQPPKMGTVTIGETKDGFIYWTSPDKVESESVLRLPVRVFWFRTGLGLYSLRQNVAL